MRQENGSVVADVEESVFAVNVAGDVLPAGNVDEVHGENLALVAGDVRAVVANVAGDAVV